MTDMNVLPASAGMIPTARMPPQAYASAPRIRGDDPPTIDVISASAMCSPHPRG